MNYPMKMWSEGGNLMTVVFGHEEHELRKTQGWVDQPPKFALSMDALIGDGSMCGEAAGTYPAPRPKPRRGRPPKVQEVSLGAGL